MTQQFTVRNWGVGHQRVVHRIGVTQTDISVPGSTVFASVREWDREGNQGHLGDARMYVCNTVVGANYVDIWMQIDWDSDLEYEVSILVVNF
jgi:hypothetical protein